MGEPSATTAGDGSYELTIVDGGGSLIAEPLAGTVDQSTGAAVTSQFSAPSGATVISPISTLVDAGLSESQVKTALGIDSSIDILNFDPVSETLYGDEPDKALSFKSASVLVSNLLDVGSEVIAGAAGSTDNFSDQVVSGIVGMIQESGIVSCGPIRRRHDRQRVDQGRYRGRGQRSHDRSLLVELQRYRDRDEDPDRDRQRGC